MLKLSTKRAAEVAKERGVADISDGTLSRWETGAAPLPRADYISVLVDLAREAGYVGVTADWLLYGSRLGVRRNKQTAFSNGGRAVTLVRVGDPERLELLTMLHQLGEAIAAGPRSDKDLPDATASRQDRADATLLLEGDKADRSERGQSSEEGSMQSARRKPNDPPPGGESQGQT